MNERTSGEGSRGCVVAPAENVAEQPVRKVAILLGDGIGVVLWLFILMVDHRHEVDGVQLFRNWRIEPEMYKNGAPVFSCKLIKLKTESVENQT